jgi:hypothetical protein
MKKAGEASPALVENPWGQPAISGRSPPGDYYNSYRHLLPRRIGGIRPERGGLRVGRGRHTGSAFLPCRMFGYGPFWTWPHEEYSGVPGAP